jgi:hypothetical protein
VDTSAHLDDFSMIWRLLSIFVAVIINAR